MESNLLRNPRYPSCVVLALVPLVWSALSHASWADSNTPLKSLLNSYLESVFHSGAKSRQLPPNTMFNQLTVFCQPMECERSRAVLSGLQLPAQRIEYTSMGAKADIVLYSDASEIPDTPSYEVEQKDRIIRTGTAQCSLVQQVNDQEIKRFFIYVHVKDNDRFLQSCILFQYLRGMGIEIWPRLEFLQAFRENESGFAVMDKPTFKKIVEGAQVFLRLHSCSLLSSIRSREEMMQKSDVTECVRILN